MFGSRGFLQHVARGVVELGALAGAVAIGSTHPWLSATAAVVGLIALLPPVVLSLDGLGSSDTGPQDTPQGFSHSTNQAMVRVLPSAVTAWPVFGSRYCTNWAAALA